MGQVVAYVPVTQQARVWFPGTSFLGEVFRGFSSPVRQMLGSFRPPRSPNIIWQSLFSSFIMGTNDLICWRTLKAQIYISTYIHTYHCFISDRSGRFKCLIWTSVPAALKWYVSGQGFLFKKLCTQSPPQVLEVCNRNFWTPCIYESHTKININTILN